MSKHKWVYGFGAGNTEGNKDQKNMLGGKGANLAEMSALNLPVPPGFTITTEACIDYGKQDGKLNSEVREQVLQAITNIEKDSGKKFGDNNNPLLFSGRSGARVSMPGMMDTVLNLGMNDESVTGIAGKTDNPRFAWDSYRRFIQMFANVVMGLEIEKLEGALDTMKESKGVKEDTELTASDLQELVTIYKKIILEDSGTSFPTDPQEQLWQSIGAVFQSWKNPRAQKYRELNGFDHDWGTAVNVQSMVFGNMGDDCATGVCFTRDPSTGDRRFFGEYLINAQGEDVVAGIRTPQPINNDSKNESNKNLQTLEEVMPKLFGELEDIYKKLEQHYRDMQDIEFTIEQDTLYILQTRSGKRTTAAALKMAVDMVEEKLLTRDEALLRINPEDLNQLLHPRFDPKAPKEVITSGLPASPGAVSGEIVFTSDQAVELTEKGHAVILVRQETSPDDIAGMDAAKGILTARGGMTSHAAVVARGMGKSCVAGCTALSISEKNKTMIVDGTTFGEGDLISLDGATGEVLKGSIPSIPAKITENFKTYMEWADSTRRLKIRANADNPKDSQVAIEFGAQGIGLCRTEHMFFAPERIMAVRQMIFATSVEERQKALEIIRPFQIEDFVGIFKEMDGLPVNIRLLDPPLHEFLPHSTEDKQALAKSLKLDLKVVEDRAATLFEFNPMLGHRGCRLGVTYPEIYRLQAQAIAEAAAISTKNGIKVYPEIMIPLVGIDRELEIIRKEVFNAVEEVLTQQKQKVAYKIGTMIELPRAAITADQIAPHADFFSFGTNDLTQTTFGLSRDDAGKFLPQYVGDRLLPVDPFVSIDQDGVGFLIERATQLGRKVNPKMHVGICGEHGGEPKSIEFCHKMGLDYVSCSPFRVPIARLAAAQAVLKEK